MNLPQTLRPWVRSPQIRATCTRVASSLAALLVAALVAARSAEASPPKASAGDAPAGDTRKTDARARFERGVGLFMDGNYESALVEFRTSIHDYPTRTTAVNIAVCLRKLGRYDEEQEALQALETTFPATTKADAAELERSKAAVADRLGKIRIVGAPPGASVFVDGRLRGTTPLAEPLVVSSGARTVRVEAPHFLAVEKRIELPAKKELEIPVFLVAERAPTEAIPAKTSVPSAPLSMRPAPTSRLPAWLLLGTGVAAAGVGTAILLGREGDVRDAKSAGCVPGTLPVAVYDRCRALADDASRAKTLGTVFLVGGGAFTVAGVVYAWVAGAGRREHPETGASKAHMHCAPSFSGASQLVCAGAF
jgi:hypothetical protein